jgi:hypothetical protein
VFVRANTLLVRPGGAPAAAAGDRVAYMSWPD